jgi:hypothetical protein
MASFYHTNMWGMVDLGLEWAGMCLAEFSHFLSLPLFSQVALGMGFSMLDWISEVRFAYPPLEHQAGDHLERQCLQLWLALQAQCMESASKSCSGMGGILKSLPVPIG